MRDRVMAALCALFGSMAACDDGAPAALVEDGGRARDALVDLSAAPGRDAEPDLAALDPDLEPPEPDATLLEADAASEADAESLEPDAEPPPDPIELSPPPFPEYTHGECPVLVGGPTEDTAVIVDFPTGETTRAFRLLVPDSYDGTEPVPLVFAWHWLNATSASFIREGELESATEQMQFIAVLPDAVRDDEGDRVFLLTWPFAEVWGVEAEFLFFDDLLACVTEQYNIDERRIYGIGVSAGGLWLTYLATTVRANYFAAIEVLSGGLGAVFDFWSLEYAPQDRKFPTLVVWGGPIDWLGISFHEASQRLRDALVDDDHFVVTCMHDAGHGVPPIEPREGDTLFRFLWTFMFDHDYGWDRNTSPYYADGLPDVFPDWCDFASSE